MKLQWLKVKKWMREHPEEFGVGVTALSFAVTALLYRDMVQRDQELRGKIIDALRTGPIFAIVTDGEKLYATEVNDQLHQLAQQIRA